MLLELSSGSSDRKKDKLMKIPVVLVLDFGIVITIVVFSHLS